MKDILTQGLKGSGLALDMETTKKLVLFLTELLRWNRQINLTSITDPNEATEKHLIDSLLLLPFLGGAKSLLDMGSGAGLPGIPLQIARPGLAICSVDSVGKKISFQRHIKRKLMLAGLTPLHCRLECLQDRLSPGQRFDVVTARAFAALDLIVPLAVPWLSSGGKILAMKGPEGESELPAAEKLCLQAGVSIESVHKYRLPFSGAERQVFVLSK